MSWRQQYRQASFRGVPFNVESIEGEFGRRQVTHEYPSLDVPFTEDLGRKHDSFSVDGYIIGTDYQLGREALIAACRDVSGPGILVHPYRGELTVTCQGLRVRESSKDGGMCVISMTFVEAGESRFPVAVVDNAGAVSAAAEKTKAAASAALAEKYNVTDFPAFVREASALQLVQFTDFFSIPGLGEIDAALEDAAKFSRDLNRLAASASGVAGDPLSMFSSVSGIISKARQIYKNAQSVMNKLHDFFSGGFSGATNTPSRKQQAANYNSTSAMIRQVALAESANASVQQEYVSYDDAIAARDELTDRLDDEAERDISDDSYLALQSLRTEAVRGVPAADQRLPRLLDYTPATTLPSLLIAHQLYGDASREADIVARNHIRHPGFVQGGSALEVLGDGQ